MADSKISALTSGNPAQSGDEIPIARGGANYKITAGSIASLSGNGDVVGPASATDNAITRFDLTTGKLVQNSGVTIDDSNNLTLPGQADLRFADSDSSNWVAFQAPATVASNVTWTLPNADGTSGQVLSTNGSGTLSWATGGGGSGTVTSVAFSTGTTGLSVTGSPITTSGTITLAGTLGVANGGTGATTLTGLVKGSGTSAFSAATAGTDYVAPAGAFSGLSWQSVQTTGFTAVAFRAYPCNTTSAAFTVTLPASPSAGDQITLTDYAGTFGTNNLTINPNGGKINSTTDNRTLGVERESITLVYIDSTQGWLTTSLVNADPYAPVFEYLVISGGGSGNVGKSASFRGSGGGAGQVKTGTQKIVTATNFTLTIGAGGAAVSNATLDVNGNAGTDSSISASVMTTVTSAGGGGGLFNTGYGGTSGNGNLGGAPNGTSGSGGGAGNGAVGGNASGTTGGNGGAGTSSSITGTSTFYAGGGGGTATSVAGSGGNGGGGAGSVASGAAGTAGSPNSGGGGGGGDYARTNGQAGGSGYIVIAYPSSIANLASVGAGLTCNGSAGNTTPDTSSRPGYKVYKFTAGTGTISW